MSPSPNSALFSGTCIFYFQEGVKTENDHINLKVAGQDGSVVQFKIKRHTPLSKLMKAYCERQVGMWHLDTVLFSKRGVVSQFYELL